MGRSVRIAIKRRQYQESTDKIVWGTRQIPQKILQRQAWSADFHARIRRDMHASHLTRREQLQEVEIVRRTSSVGESNSAASAVPRNHNRDSAHIRDTGTLEARLLKLARRMTSLGRPSLELRDIE